VSASAAFEQHDALPAPGGAGGRAADPPANGPAAAATDPAADLLVRRAPRRTRVWVRVASYLVTVFVLITLNFALPRLIPGDPIDALFSQGNPSYAQDDTTRARLEEYYNLDGSTLGQYGRYLGALAQGDLGVSIVSNRAVAPELFDAVRWTFLLIGASTLVSIAIGLPTGVHSGWKRGRRTDRALLSVFLLWENVPVFVLGALCYVVLAGKLGLFPAGGGVTALNEYGTLGQIVDVVRHLALPALVMGGIAASGHYLLMRSSMVGELGADYLLLGRAKGLRDRRLKYRYAGRNALLPVVTGIGLQVGLGLSTVVFIEQIFSYPGVGGAMVGAIGTRDYPVLQGAFLLLTLSVVTINLVVDLLYRWVDPRTAA
jgi:peptide/nickel transport system permease protein